MNGEIHDSNTKAKNKRKIIEKILLALIAVLPIPVVQRILNRTNTRLSIIWRNRTHQFQSQVYLHHLSLSLLHSFTKIFLDLSQWIVFGCEWMVFLWPLSTLLSSPLNVEFVTQSTSEHYLLSFILRLLFFFCFSRHQRRLCFCCFQWWDVLAKLQTDNITSGSFVLCSFFRLCYCQLCHID